MSMPILLIAAMLAAPLQLRLVESPSSPPPILESPYRTQRTAGYIVLGSGGVLISAGVVMLAVDLGYAISEICMADANNCSARHPELRKDLFAGGLISIGGGAVLAVTGVFVMLDAQRKMNVNAHED
jgi:hypothetical protein